MTDKRRMKVQHLPRIVRVVAAVVLIARSKSAASACCERRVNSSLARSDEEENCRVPLASSSYTQHAPTL